MPNSRGVDPETAKAFERGDILRGLVESQGWAIVKEILYDKIKTLDSISSLPLEDDPTKIGLQAMYRNHAIGLVLDWVATIEGDVEQFREQSRLVAEMQADQVIRHYSTSS